MSHSIDRRVPPHRLQKFQVRAIRWLARKSLLSQQQIGEIFKTTQSNVHYIIYRHTHSSLA